MIVEGLLTTTAADGRPHVAPMGPVVSTDFSSWTLRPFQTSSTFAALRETPHCVFHIVDDVLPIVRTALGMKHDFQLQPHPDGGHIITDACRWFRLEIQSWDISDLRSEAVATVHSQGSLRDFWGWNRAKHAVLEATILATRRHMLDAGHIASELEKLESAVKKTCGPREWQAWTELTDFLAADHNR
ncbi:MAG: DUF447 family protein [Aureliella sp.]